MRTENRYVWEGAGEKWYVHSHIILCTHFLNIWISRRGVKKVNHLEKILEATWHKSKYSSGVFFFRKALSGDNTRLPFSRSIKSSYIFLPGHCCSRFLYFTSHSDALRYVFSLSLLKKKRKNLESMIFWLIIFFGAEQVLKKISQESPPIPKNITLEKTFILEAHKTTTTTTLFFSRRQLQRVAKTDRHRTKNSKNMLYMEPK